MSVASHSTRDRPEPALSRGVDLVSAAIAAATSATPPDPALADAITGRAFERLRSSVIETLPRAVQERTATVFRTTAGAVRAARSTNGVRPPADIVGAAETALSHAAGLVALAPEPASRALGDSAVFSATAYVKYVRGNYGDAVADLQRANDADLALMSLGWSAMHGHRIQLLHNLVRLEFHCGRKAGAFLLVDGILNHLRQDTIANCPLGGPWTGLEIRGCPEVTIAALGYQVAGEFAYWKYKSSLGAATAYGS